MTGPDQGFAIDSLQSHEIPPPGRISYAKNADGTFSPIGGANIVPPGSYLSAGAANQDSTIVKNVPTSLFALCFQNTHATAMRYVKLYDKATGPTSADTPVGRYALAPAGGGVTRQQISEKFTNGLSFRITTGPLDNDTGAASAGDVFVNLDAL